MNKISLKRIGTKNDRPRAFWGSLIASALGGAFQLISNNSSNRAAEANLRRQIAAQNEQIYKQNRLLAANNQADLLNKYYLAEREYKNNNNNFIYKCGGKVKASKGLVTNMPGNTKIVNGGVAEPLGNNTFLLRGRSHNNGGIDINYGNRKIEAEGGEITDIDPKSKQARIFSKHPMIPIYAKGRRLTLISPANLVLAGYPKSQVFAVQQQINGNKSTPVKRNKDKAELGDWIKLGIDVGSSLLNGFSTNRRLKNIANNTTFVKPEYYEETPVVLNTTYNNSAQRSNLERQRQLARNIIRNNSMGSQTTQHRIRLSDLDNIYKQNELADYKANQEIALRNAQKQIEQEVRGRNTASRNAWSDKVASIQNAETEFKNNIKEKQIANINQTIAGLGQASENYFNTVEQRNADNKALLAMIASSNPGSYATFVENGGLDKQGNFDLYRNIYNKSNKTEDDIKLARAAYNRLSPRQIERLRRLYNINN